MTLDGYIEYVYAVYGNQTNTAPSYIKAIEIIDEMFRYDDALNLKGQSIASINDSEVLARIVDYVYEQQRLYKNKEDSIFRNIKKGRTSYPKNGFCSAAVKQLIKYHEHELEKEANKIIEGVSKGNSISKKLIDFFDAKKEGSYVEVSSKARVGQQYFRKMVLANYGNKCCVTGMNVPEILRASHILPWADNVQNRMNPENGLCLSATYDAAFDKHLISFDEKYRIITVR